MEIWDASKYADHVNPTDSNQCIDDSAEPGHISKGKSDQVKTEKTDQSPVDSSNDYDGKNNVVNDFCVHRLSLLY